MPHTLPEVESQRDPVARLVLAYGFLEQVLSTVDEGKANLSFGNRLQLHKAFLGEDLLNQANHGLRVRNAVSHGERVAKEEVIVAGQHLLQAARCLMSRLREADKKRFLGTAYRPPKKTQRPKRRKEISTTAQKEKAKRKQKRRQVPLSLVVQLVKALMRRESVDEVTREYATQGYSMSDLPSQTVSKLQRRRLQKLYSSLVTVERSKNRKDKAKAAFRCRNWLSHIDPTLIQLKPLVEAFLHEHGQRVTVSPTADSDNVATNSLDPSGSWLPDSRVVGVAALILLVSFVLLFFTVGTE